MLAALWNKRKQPQLIQKQNALPYGYRSTVMPTYVRQKFGAVLLRWGATAIRGDLTAKKAHISTFIELVNELPQQTNLLEEAFDRIAFMLTEYLQARSPIITIPSASRSQQVLTAMLNQPSGGRVQQGLVYALVKTLYDEPLRTLVRTKPVFAGDRQSGQLGDVEVIDIPSGKIITAVEVKAQKLDQLTYDDVVRTHSAQDRAYLLLILVEAIKARIVSNDDSVFIIRLPDFCYPILAEIIIHKKLSAEEAIHQVLVIYNDFCDNIQKDSTLRIDS